MRYADRRVPTSRPVLRSISSCATELGHAVLDGTTAVTRERPTLAFGDVIDMKVLIPNEGDVAARW